MTRQLTLQDYEELVGSEEPPNFDHLEAAKMGFSTCDGCDHVTPVPELEANEGLCDDCDEDFLESEETE